MTNKRIVLANEGDATRHTVQTDASTATSANRTSGNQSVMSQQKTSFLSCFSSSEKSTAATGKAKKSRRGGRKNDLNAAKAKVTHFSKDANIQQNLLPAAITKEAGLFTMAHHNIDGTKKIDVRKKSNRSQSTYQRKSNTLKNFTETYQSNQLKTNLPIVEYHNLQNQPEKVHPNSTFNANITDQYASGTSNATRYQKPNTSHPPGDDILMNAEHRHPSTPARKPADQVGDSSAFRQHSSTKDLNRMPRSSRRDKDRGRARSALRERSRVEELRQGYQKLQAAIPAVPKNTKLAKLDVLVLAASYIAHLTRLLKEDEESGVCHEGADCFEGPPPGVPPTHPPPTNTCCRQQPLKMPGKRWPMRARLYAAVGASPPDATRCSCGSACAVGTQRTSLAPHPLLPQHVSTTTRQQEVLSLTLQEEFPEKDSMNNCPGYYPLMDKSSTGDNFFDFSSRSTSLGRSFSGYHDLIDFSNYDRSSSGDHNLECNIYESIFDSAENYYVEADNSIGIHASRQAFLEPQKIHNVNRDGCYAFSNPEYESPAASCVSDYNLVASWPSTVKKYNKECQLPPRPNTK